MTILYKAAGFFTEGMMAMVQSPSVHYVEINITSNGFMFEGTLVAFQGLTKNSIGFHFEIPWSVVTNVYKTKARMMHVVQIRTIDNIYTILPLDPVHTSGLGVSSSKRLSKALIETIDKARVQVENLKKKFCTECGEPLKEGSDFCGNCGNKVP